MSTAPSIAFPEVFPSSGEETAIRVRGARVHNLKNITVSFPLHKLTVVTGVSGSGKTSLAFDTVYAEGQRRYVESLSAYARQFLERIDKPDVDDITGICPAIAVRQKNSARNPRSTVATQTEIHDYMRLLFARVGKTICPECDGEVKRDNPQSVAETVLALSEGTRFYVLFPAEAGFVPEVPRGDEDAWWDDEDEDGGEDEEKSRKPERRKTRRAVAPPEPTLFDTGRRRVVAHVMSLMQRGFTRLYRQGEVIDLATPDDYTRDDFVDVFVLADRLVVRPDIRDRLVDSLETAYREGHGHIEIHAVGDEARRLRFSDAFECKTCQVAFPPPEPRLFSFNNPYGACPTCQGFGNTMGVNPGLVIPNHKLTLGEGAVDPWTKPQFEWALTEMHAACDRFGIPTDVPYCKLDEAHRRIILDGADGWPGVRGFFDWLETKKYKLHVRVLLAKYRSYTTCPDCGGGRLRREARAVKIAGVSMPNILAKSIDEAARFFDDLILPAEETRVAEKLLTEIRRRLRFLKDVGLEYLTLDRLTSTLSGGEAQRIQLATHLGASLVGALYVLDEPSIGLHPRDNRRLIRVLEGLRDIGNTVIVVEHDPEMMLAADHIVDIGPGAGELGGEVLFQGPFSELQAVSGSLTAKYLRREARIKPPQTRRVPTDRMISIRGASEHNLKHIDVDIPLGLMVCVTGVSGSGKSTLVHEVLYRGLQPEADSGRPDPSFEIEGGGHLDEVVCIDQSPIGRTPRSNPATYVKVYDAIREVFAQTREARHAGLTPSHFSFNVPGGRCETCQGDGTVTIEMQFLADVELMCEDCRGKRFKSEILDIKYRGRNIFEVLNLTVREAGVFFHGLKRITDRLKVLDEVGLGYLRLGQSATTLSGGEAQRIKLAAYLAKPSSARTLYIFDEPTTGLHFDDINKLLLAFRRLLDMGASLVVIEHNLDVMKTADWILDLGPEGGHGGGDVVGYGPPEVIAELPGSHTGRFLKSVLDTEKSA